MRELLTSEVKLVSGAGVVTNSEKGQVVKDALTILSKIPATKPGAEFTNWYWYIFQGVGGINSMFQ